MVKLDYSLNGSLKTAVSYIFDIISGEKRDPIYDIMR